MNGPPSLRSEDKWMRVTEPSLLWILCELKDTKPSSSYGFQDSGVLVQWTGRMSNNRLNSHLTSTETGLEWAAGQMGEGLTPWGLPEEENQLRLSRRSQRVSPNPTMWLPSARPSSFSRLQNFSLRTEWEAGLPWALSTSKCQGYQGLLISDRRKPLAMWRKPLISEGTKVREINHRKDAGTLFDTGSTTSIITTYSLIWINFKVLVNHSSNLAILSEAWRLKAHKQNVGKERCCLLSELSWLAGCLPGCWLDQDLNLLTDLFLHLC